jgi:hypothetical protein
VASVLLSFTTAFHKALQHFLSFINAKLYLQKEVHLSPKFGISISLIFKLGFHDRGLFLNAAQLLLQLGVLMLVVDVLLFFLVDLVYQLLEMCL